MKITRGKAPDAGRSLTRAGWSRREVLKAAGIGIGLGAAPGFIRNAGASTARKIKFTLPWIPSGQHAYAFNAKPFWAEKGLDVQIDRGFGSGEAAKAIGLDRYEFGEASYSVMVNSVAQGLDLMAIGAKTQRSAFAIFALKGSGITKPKDLEGKTVISSSGSADLVMFPAFAKLAGIDANKVKFLLVAPNVRHPMLLGKKADAMTGLVVSDGAALLGQGAPVDIIMFSDYGFRMLDLGLMTPAKRVREEPQLVADFVEGAMKGMKRMLLKPRRSIDLTLQSIKEYQGAAAGPSIIEHSLEIADSLATVPAVEQHGLGFMDPGDWVETVNLVNRYMPGTQRVEAPKVYTNQFVGIEKLTPQEWAAVKARVRKFLPV